MGPYAGVDYNYNLTLCPLSVDYNTFTMGNPMPESALTLCQSQLYPPDRDFGFSLRSAKRSIALSRLHFWLLNCVNTANTATCSS